jgi:hypothetical protein
MQTSLLFYEQKMSQNNSSTVPNPAEYKRDTYFTSSMEQSPSWEAKTSSATQEIPHILWNPKVHNRIHNSTPPVPTGRSLVQGSPTECGVSLCVI